MHNQFSNQLNPSNLASTASTFYAAPPPAAPSRQLDQVRESLSSAIQVAATLGQRARSIADDVFGGRALQQAVGSAGMAPKESLGRLPDLSDQTTTLHKLLEELAAEIDRLSCI